MKPSAVSVVVITRGRAEALAHTLPLLLALPERPPVIVVENGSADDTATLLRERFPDVTHVALEGNLGAAARNVGAAQAHTPYVAFSDDDSWWEPGALARAAELLDAHPRLALIAARILVEPGARLDPTCEAMADSPLRRGCQEPGTPVLGFVACGAVVRRAAFAQVGGFQRRYGTGGEEGPLALELAEAGHRLAYVPEIVAHHRPWRAGGDHSARRATVLRNELWFAWQREPAAVAVARTLELVRRAASEQPARRALLQALCGAASVLAVRRPTSAALAADLRALRRQRRPA